MIVNDFLFEGLY